MGVQIGLRILLDAECTRMLAGNLTEPSDKFDITHAKELFDHRVWSQHNLALLHLHCRPTMYDVSVISLLL